MKSVILVAAALLHTWSGAASVINVGDPSLRMLPRELVPRDGRDCGKFVMYCEKAAGACNNACYHINCFDKDSATMMCVLKSLRFDFFALLMIVLASMQVKPTTVIVSSPGARPLTAPFATNCRSAKCFTIRSITNSEISRSTVMNGQWPQPNKTTSKKAQSEIVFDAYPPARILVR